MTCPIKTRMSDVGCVRAKRQTHRNNVLSGNHYRTTVLGIDGSRKMGIGDTAVPALTPTSDNLEWSLRMAILSNVGCVSAKRQTHRDDVLSGKSRCVRAWRLDTPYRAEFETWGSRNVAEG